MTRRRFFRWAALGAAVIAIRPLRSGAAAQPRKVVFWFSPFSDESYLKLYLPWWEEQLKKTLPRDVAVEVLSLSYPDMERNYLIQARSGRPDIIEGLLEQSFIYESAELLEPLTDSWAAWPDRAQFTETFVQPFQFKGQQWALPYTINARGLVYRKSILDKYGLPVPKTWEELKQTAALITAKEKGMTGYMVSSLRGTLRPFHEFLSHAYQLSPGVFALKQGRWQVEITAEQLTRVLQFYYDLFFSADGSSSAIPPSERGKAPLEMDLGYTVGKHAMIPTGPFVFTRRLHSELQNDILTKDTGVAPLPLPAGPGALPRTYLEAKPLMINRYGQLKDVSWEVIKLFCGRESIARLAAIAGTNSPRQDSAALLPQFLDPVSLAWQGLWTPLLSTGRAPEPVQWNEPRSEMFDAMESVIFQTSSPRAAAQRLHERLQELAKRF